MTRKEYLELKGLIFSEFENKIAPKKYKILIRIILFCTISILFTASLFVFQNISLILCIMGIVLAFSTLFIYISIDEQKKEKDRIMNLVNEHWKKLSVEDCLAITCSMMFPPEKK